MEAVAAWMIEHGYVTGHGDTLDDLLMELVIQVTERAVARTEARLAVDRSG